MHRSVADPGLWVQRMAWLCGSQASLARLAGERLDLTQESNKHQKNDDETILSNFPTCTLDN